MLLLTNEGDLAAALTHPGARIEREYLARVAGQVTARSVKALKSGVQLEDGFARPKRVRKVHGDEDESGLTLVLTEGRKREVRRLLKAVGHPARALVRTRFGPFRLGGLKPGQWRPARADELREARSLTAARGRAGRGRPGPPRRHTGRGSHV